jgi:hypothetical protein
MTESYKNNFGELNEAGITITVQNKKQTILLNNIVRIKFIKRQKYHLNYTAFLVATYLLLYIKNNTLSNITQILIIIVAVLLLGTSLYLKLFQSKFILIKKNDFIAIEVNKKLSKDAENLANKWLKKITH